MKRFVAAAIAGAMSFGGVQASFAADRTADDAARLAKSRAVIEEIESAPDKGIPQSILAGATCVVVIPGLKKAAFLVGAEYGKGVVSCRTGHGWSAPTFVQLKGGSFGFQAGGQSTDLVLVAMNQGALDHMLHDKFKIGADAAAAAGPVGRNAQAATDIALHAEFLTYSRSRGLFAGIDLNGAELAQDNDDTRGFYGADVSYKGVLGGETPTPEAAKPFVRTVAKYFVISKDNH